MVFPAIPVLSSTVRSIQEMPEPKTGTEPDLTITAASPAAAGMDV